MASRHMERHYTSYVIREMQMKTMSYHHTPIRMAKIPNTDNVNAGEMKQHKLIAGVDAKWYSYFGRLVGSFSQN